MKKLYLSIFLVSSIITATSQTKSFNLLLKAGINVSHYDLPKQYSTNGRSIINKGNMQNFQVGFLASIPLLKILALQSGVSINGKGGKIEVSKPYDYFWESLNTRSIYFEIPINLIYTQHITKSLKFVAGGGPYLSVGIGGKNNYFGTTGDLTGYPFSGNKTITYGRQTDKFEGTYSRLTAIDFGLNAITAFEYKKCQIYFNYGFGLQDVKPKGVPMNMGKNRTLTFGMGYTLR